MAEYLNAEECGASATIFRVALYFDSVSVRAFDTTVTVHRYKVHSVITEVCLQPFQKLLRVLSCILAVSVCLVPEEEPGGCWEPNLLPSARAASALHD